MDESMIKFQQNLIESEFEAENLLLAKNQMVENDKVRNGNREALTALRKIAKTTKTSVSSPFESLMKEMEGTGSRSLVKEVCPTCGNHDPKENSWMMFPGTDQSNLDYDTKKLQSYVKDKSLWISEKGYIADKISPSVVRSMVTLTDNSK